MKSVLAYADYDEKTGELTGGHLYWQKMKMGEK